MPDIEEDISKFLLPITGQDQLVPEEPRKDVEVGKLYQYVWPDGRGVVQYVVTGLNKFVYSVLFSNGETSTLSFGCQINLGSMEAWAFEPEIFHQRLEQEVRLAMQQERKTESALHRAAIARIRVGRLLRSVKDRTLEKFEHITEIPSREIEVQMDQMLPPSKIR